MIFEITTYSFFATPYFWVFVGLVFLLFELGAPGLFYFLSFTLAAFCTAVASVFISSLLYQMLFFVFSTIISIYVLRIWLVHMLEGDGVQAYESNVAALLGKNVNVIVEIAQDNSGQVKVAGEIWSARSVDGQKIKKDSRVIIIKVIGVHLIVKKID